MCFSQVQPCLSIVAVLLSAALGGCTLNVLAQTRQIMFNVLLVLRLGFLRSLIINTENQDRTVVSLRQGRQSDVVSGITCRSEKGRGSPCVCSSSSRPTCSPLQALLQGWMGSQASSSLCLGTQSPAQPADALCPLPESSAGLLVLLLDMLRDERD